MILHPLRNYRKLKKKILAFISVPRYNIHLKQRSRGLTSQKTVAVLGSDYRAVCMLDACERAGYRGIIIGRSWGKLHWDGTRNFYSVPIKRSLDDIAKDVADICRFNKIDGIVATNDFSIPIASLVAQWLHLPGNPFEAASAFRDKFRNRECVRKIPELHNPKYCLVRTLDDIRNSGIDFPFVLKPLDQAGKRGLTVVRNALELNLAFDYATSFKKINVIEASDGLLMEEFLEGGMEYSAESLSYKGKHTIVQITEKDSSGPPHCVELGFHQPAPISDEMWSTVVRSIDAGLTAIGLTNGPCHTEFKIINGKVYLLEFNPRLSGNHLCDTLIPLSTGFDYLAALAKASTGDLEDIDVSSFSKKYAGMYLVVEQNKELKPIFDNCEKQKWCYEKHCYSEKLVEMKTTLTDEVNYFIYVSENNNPVKALLSPKNTKFGGQ